jgi:exonuclease SbcD
MRFIHIADLHLGSSPEAEFLWGKNRAEEIWDSFAAVIDACNEKEIDLLLIAGDLFDRPPVWADLDRAAKLFARLTATEVVMIAGASDYITEDSPWKTYPWQSWVHMLSDKHCMNVQMGNINTSVHGCSYYALTEGKPYLEDARPDKESEYQILLGYTGDDNHMPADLSELSEKGFDYIALGYEHKASVMQNMHIAYAGSLEPLSVQETGKHGFILGEINEENTTIRFVPFACREYINIKVRLSSDITEDELEEKLTAAINQYGSDNIFTISLEGRYQPKEPYDRARLLALGNVADVKDGTMPDYNLVALLDEHKDDMIGMYLEEFLKEPAGAREQKALYCGLEALLNAVQKTR